ncbi:CatA-like O-acetyltransferase, partial [Pseudoalteromonas sp. 41-MNA-CIBAN-0057]
MSSTDFSITPLDFEQWPRKQHFELFQQFTQPYFNVCVQLNAKKLYTACKQANIAFYHGYIYCLLKACHQYE